MATKRPAPVARGHTQHTLLVAQHQAAHAAKAQQHQAAHTARLQQHQQSLATKQAAHAAAVQRKADARAARRNGSAVVAPPAGDTLATPIYATGSSGGGASGYGGGYQYAESQADTGADATTGGDSDTQAAKKSGGLSTRTKVLLGVGGGVLLVGFIAYQRYVARPLRRYRQVRGLVSNIAEGYRNFKTELAK